MACLSRPVLPELARSSTCGMHSWLSSQAISKAFNTRPWEWPCVQHVVHS